MRNRKNIYQSIMLLVGIVVVAGGLIMWGSSLNNSPDRLDTFAACLGDQGAIFYGAFWCPHCQTQKAMFGRSERLLPYVECSTPNGRGQLSTCQEKNITGYPTWEFADGIRESGEISLRRLAEKTGCELPLE